MFLLEFLQVLKDAANKTIIIGVIGENGFISNTLSKTPDQLWKM